MTDIMTEEQQQAWVKEKYHTATKYLADKGLVTESISELQSRYLVPALAIWKINLLDKTSVWVVCGELPTDHCADSIADNARDAVRHFSLKWQLQAENLLKQENAEQEEFANILIAKAHSLYLAYEKEELWQS